MTLSEKKVQKILNYGRLYTPIEVIATISKIRRSTVKEYLRKAGLYPYPNKQASHTPQGVPELVSYTYDNPQWEQQLPQQNYKEQIALEEGPKLVRELNKSNKEKEDLKQKILQVTDDKEKIQEKCDKLTDSIGKIEEDHRRELEQNKKDNEEFKQQVTKLTSEKETEKQEKDKYKNKLIQQQEDTIQICLNHKYEIKKLKDRDTNRELYLQELRNALQRLPDGVEQMLTKIDNQNKMIQTITEEKNKFKEKIESLEQSHQHDWMLSLAIALVSFVAGMVVDRTVIPKIKNFILSWGAEHGVNTADVANQFSQVYMVQPDTHDNDSGTIQTTNTSGTSWSGAFDNSYGNTYSAGCEPVPNLCSGACPPTHGYIGAGNPVVPNPQDDMIQADIQESGDVTISMYTSGTTQSSGVVMINHIETMSIPQAASSHYIPPPQISPVYFYPQYTPVPPELIGPFGLIPIRYMDWRQSTPFICWLFEQLGSTIIKVKKSHDKGADIHLERFGEILVIQIKHQMEHTGIRALQEALYAKQMLDATKAIVISFGSPFTQSAIRDEKKSGVELWDLQRVITELCNHRIYYPID